MYGLLVPTLIAVVSIVYLLLVRLRRTHKYKIRLPPGVSRDRQAIEQDDQPGVYRSGMLVTEKQPLEKYYKEVNTLYDAFLRGLEVSNNGDCAGYRPGDRQPYHFMTYTDVLQKARDFGSALIGDVIGAKYGNDSFVGVYAKNSPEWLITKLACIQQSMVVVPLYDTLGPDAAAYIINQTEIRVVVADTVKKAEVLVEATTALPTLKHIVVIEAVSIPETSKAKAEAKGIHLHTFQDAIQYGRKNSKEMHLPKPDDLYIICYTSGTTGTPKGVMLTHRNLVSNVAGFVRMLADTVPWAMDEHHTLISYLPLSHMMEQSCDWWCLTQGHRIGYFSGNIQKLTEDMKTLQPTIFPVVPRLLNRLYSLIHGQLAKAGPVKRFIFGMAYKAKLAELKAGIVSNDSLWDRFVFAKLQQELGGRVRFMATGSAPVSAEVLETCRVTLGATIVECYGQTECSALASSSWPGDTTGGHVGGPAPTCLMKLRDVPDLNYFASENKGELCIKGPHVTQGYYKDPERTAELFDDDGFILTGDVGQLLPNGTFKVIDRKKHIFKLAQGEYVAPEKIENVYVKSPVVAQIYVDGNSLQRHLVAIVVPDTNVLRQWYKDHVKDNGVSLEELCKSPMAKQYVLEQLQKIGKDNRLNSIEQVKAVHLCSEPFTVEGGLLTPTLKAKRPQLRQHFARVIDQLYEESNVAE